MFAVLRHVQECDFACEDCGLTFTEREAYDMHLHQHALDEEEAQMEVNESSASAEALGSAGEDRGDEEAETKPTEPSLSTDTYWTSVDYAGRTVYHCRICGKIYTYEVSFRKHQYLHAGPPEPQRSKTPPDPNLRKYECPECGVSFIRRTRLVSHLRIHRSQSTQSNPRCEQCNKQFASLKSWLAHLDLHNERRFWCLSCAQGFVDELTLDKHLQRHSLSHFKHKAAYKFLPPKVYTCKICGLNVSRVQNFLFHQKKHAKEHAKSVKEEEELRPMSEPAEMTSDVDGSAEKPAEVEECAANGESGDVNEETRAEKSDDSGCGEPAACLKTPEVPNLTDQAEEERAPIEQEPEETTEDAAHKYREWECILCDTGFDEVGELHVHYMKHATGEIPMEEGAK